MNKGGREAGASEGARSESPTATTEVVPGAHAPAAKLADAELLFTGGDIDGLKLIGFGMWERRGGTGRNVTLPARQYSVNGERRSFALLRPVVDTAAQDRVRGTILEAYAEFEQEVARAS